MYSMDNNGDYKSYPYEFEFTEEIKNNFLSAEFVEWVHENIEEDCMFIKQHGKIWGITFSSGRDAIAFQLRWR